MTERDKLIELLDGKSIDTSADVEYVADYLMANGVIVGDAKNATTTDVVEIPESGIGDVSDGYHTFNELYHHRAVLFSVICNMMPDKAWKSKLHDTGDMYDGMFIVGIDTPQGQATYHYDINPYWDMFNVKELEKAPEWDGHTPAQAIERIGALGTDMAPVVRCKDCEYWDETTKEKHVRSSDDPTLEDFAECTYFSSFAVAHFMRKDDYCSLAKRRGSKCKKCT